jgi:hypothetical protein
LQVISAIFSHNFFKDGSDLPAILSAPTSSILSVLEWRATTDENENYVCAIALQ